VNYDAFIDRVQKYGSLETTQQAEKATESTLLTLGERLAGAEAENLASQLPKEAATLLAPSSSEAPSLTLEQFFERVGSRLDPPRETDTAGEIAKAVMAAVREAVSEGELRDAAAQLPREYASLFGSETLHH